MAIDTYDRAEPASPFAETARIDFSEAGLPGQSMTREEFAVFSEQDPSTARLTSYMFAQHHADGEPPFVMHGSYEHVVIRTAAGWKIVAPTRHLFWKDNALAAMQLSGVFGAVMMVSRWGQRTVGSAQADTGCPAGEFA